MSSQQTVGLFVVFFALIGFIFLFWKTNRVLEADLRKAEEKANTAYRASDRYKERIVLLESALEREQELRKAGNDGVAALFGLMLLAEWGGFRLGKTPDGTSCGAVIHTPSGRLFFYYPVELDFRFEHVPLKQDWDWDGAEHTLLWQCQKQISDDLLLYVKSKLQNDQAQSDDTSAVERTLGVYQTDSIGFNVHEYAPPVYEHATATGDVRAELTLSQFTRECNIQMDESSAQPVKAPRCMSCGVWTDTPCKPGGAIPTQQVISTHLVQEPTRRLETSPPLFTDDGMVYVHVRRDSLIPPRCDPEPDFGSATDCGDSGSSGGD